MSRGGGNAGNASDKNYGLSLIDVRGREMIWLNRVVGYTSERRAKKVVTDVLVPSEVPGDYTLEFGICGTRRTEQFRVQPEPSDVKVDPEIIAVIEKGKTKVLTHARHAWRADQDTGQFREVDPGRVVCLNDALVGH